MDSDAIASVFTSGLIGDKYVAIALGGGDPLQNGGTIRQTQSAFQLETAIGKLIDNFGGGSSSKSDNGNAVSSNSPGTGAAGDLGEPAGSAEQQSEYDAVQWGQSGQGEAIVIMTIGNSTAKAVSGTAASSSRSLLVLALTVALALVAVTAGWAPSTARADSGAMGVTQNMVNQALQILGSKATPLPQRRRQLRDLVEQNFNFATMSRSALGYNWRSLSA